MRQQIVSPQMLRRISLFTLELKLHNFIQALERCYNPNWPAQPRIPGGEPIGSGRWTAGGGSLPITGHKPERGATRVANVIYVCTRVGAAPFQDEYDNTFYAMIYLCGRDQELISITSSKLWKPIIRDPRF